MTSPHPTLRRLLPAGAIAWLVVGGAGTVTVVDESDDWQLRYVVFSVALLAAVAVLFAAGLVATQGAGRRGPRLAGLAVLGLGVLTSLVAWAIPVWMTVIGVAFCVLAVVDTAPQRAFAALAAAQLGGVVVFVGATRLEVGRVDEYGDYPIAAALGISFAAAMTVCSLVALWSSTSPAPRSSTSPAPSERHHAIGLG